MWLRYQRKHLFFPENESEVTKATPKRTATLQFLQQHTSLETQDVVLSQK